MITSTLTLIGNPAALRPATHARKRWPIAMLGVAFDAVTISEALARIEAMIATRRPHYVVTPNVDFLAQASRDDELRHILREADLVLCDGTPLVWASRWLGNPLPERVAGADLTPRLIALAAQKNYRLFLLGATPEANAQAAARLRERHPGLALAGYYAPPFAPLREMNHDEIARRIRDARPDILLVSFGCPKQEKWIAMHYQALGVPVCLGVGAVIDFLAGHVSRAPRWMQRGGVEWLYRLAQEPRRLFRRYFDDLRFFGGALLAQCWQLRWRAVPRTHGWSMWAHDLDAHSIRVETSGYFGRAAIERTAPLWDDIVTRRRDCVVDLARVEFVDSTGIGLLVRLHHRLIATGHHLTLLCPSEAVRRAFASMHLSGFFKVARTPSTPPPHVEPQRQAA